MRADQKQITGVNRQCDGLSPLSYVQCKAFHLNGVQTELKCKPNVKRCKRFVFVGHSPLLHHNTLKTKAITLFQADHILTRFVFPPLLATYPLAALCLHTEFSPLPGLTFRESLYNGVASDRINRQFRFCPRSDGMFNIGSLSYHIGEEDRHHGYYAVGYALGSSPSETSADKTFNYALWTLIEQPLLHIGESHLGAMWQGGTSPASRSTCRHYWGAGLIWSNIPPRMTQVGLVVNRALYADGRETDVELTGSFPVCNHFTLQPAVHCINTNGNYTAAAQLRAILEFGN